METIRRGSKGPVVQAWEEFLRGQDLFMEEANGDFDAATEAATKFYQKANSLSPADGIVGNRTWGQAMLDGFELLKDTDDSREGPNWPPKPEGLVPASFTLRQQLFGTFTYEPAPVKGNPEGINILGGWSQKNITTVVVPQLIGVEGAHPKGLVSFNKKAVPQLLALFKAWEDAGLLHLVLSWGGSWAPRFVRGSRTSLSNHAYGSAFDICVAWNGLRVVPALVGQKGSVRELVPLAVEFGFYWGGWGFGVDRKDGMHLEISKILTEDEINAVVSPL